MAEPNGKSVTTTEVMPPVPITVIGNSDGLVTGTKATTPPDQPNLVVNVVQPVVALVVRFVNVYVGNVVGLLAVGMTSDALAAPDFLQLLLKCASLGVAGAVVLSLKDIVTVFGRLEQRFPLASGSV